MQLKPPMDFFKNLFIFWLHWVSCGTQDLSFGRAGSVLWHAGFSLVVGPQFPDQG